jgi:hypothetical protein
LGEAAPFYKRGNAAPQALTLARRVAKANLKICEQHRFTKDIGLCQRALGDLAADDGNQKGACAHYDQALQIARGITYRPALIETLRARGRWAARYLGDAPAAFRDLNEALSYALDGGYRTYEGDTRVALAPRPMEGEGPGGRVDAEEVRGEIERGE